MPTTSRSRWSGHAQTKANIKYGLVSNEVRNAVLSLVWGEYWTNWIPCGRNNARNICLSGEPCNACRQFSNVEQEYVDVLASLGYRTKSRVKAENRGERLNHDFTRRVEFYVGNVSSLVNSKPAFSFQVDGTITVDELQSCAICLDVREAYITDDGRVKACKHCAKTWSVFANVNFWRILVERKRTVVIDRIVSPALPVIRLREVAAHEPRPVNLLKLAFGVDSFGQYDAPVSHDYYFATIGAFGPWAEPKKARNRRFRHKGDKVAQRQVHRRRPQMDLPPITARELRSRRIIVSHVYKTFAPGVPQNLKRDPYTTEVLKMLLPYHNLYQNSLIEVKAAEIDIVAHVVKKKTKQITKRVTIKEIEDETKRAILDKYYGENARRSKVSGAGTCWRKLFPLLKHEDKMTYHDFRKLALASVQSGKPVDPDGLIVSDLVGSMRMAGTSVYLEFTDQFDGDLHLNMVWRKLSSGRFVPQRTIQADIYIPDKEEIRPEFLADYDAGYITLPLIGPVKMSDLKPADFISLGVLKEYTRDIDTSKLIAITELPENPLDIVLKVSGWQLPPLKEDDILVGAATREELKPIVRQLPDVFDITLDPTVLAYSKDLLVKSAKWYWDRATRNHFFDHAPGQPGGPKLPWHNHSTPILEYLGKQLEALFHPELEHIRKAYYAILAKLAEYGIHPDNYVKLFILNFKHFIGQLAESAKDTAKYVFDNYGLGWILESAGHVVDVLATFLTDIYHMAYNVTDYLLLGLKIVFFFLQDFTEFHGPDHIYRRALLKGDLNIRQTSLNKLERFVEGRNNCFQTSLSNRLMHLNEQANRLSATNAAENVTVASARDKVQEIITDIDALPPLILPENTPPEIVTEFTHAFPEFNTVTGVNPHPHAKLSAIRRAFRSRANDHLAPRNRPVRAVGASNTEMPTIDRLVHNCWPTDSGRTSYRKESHCNPNNAMHRAMTHDHNFQDCTHEFGDIDVYGADIWSFFSAHDIPPETFIREMAESGSTTAVIALHLPFPLLDRRVKTYVDTTVGLRYEVEGDKLLVYHVNGGSAGYAHDFETVYAWMHNLPNFTGAHVQIEMISQLATAVLFTLTIGKGKQEVVPSLWSCQTEPFYILPELLDDDLRTGERPHFAVTARRFEQLVAYVATLEPEERTTQNVIVKLRGMLAEIRVGIHVVEHRWSVTIPQMHSLVLHAILAHDLHHESSMKVGRKFRSYYSRVSWRFGPAWKRAIQYRLDLLTFRAGGERYPLDNPMINWLFGNKFDHTHVYNPYQRAVEYRVVNLDQRHSNKLAPVPKSALKWAGSKLKTSVWAATGALARASSDAAPVLGRAAAVAATSIKTFRMAGSKHRPPVSTPTAPRPCAIEDVAEEQVIDEGPYDEHVMRDAMTVSALEAPMENWNRRYHGMTLSEHLNHLREQRKDKKNKGKQVEIESIIEIDDETYDKETEEMIALRPGVPEFLSVGEMKPTEVKRLEVKRVSELQGVTNPSHFFNFNKQRVETIDDADARSASDESETVSIDAPVIAEEPVDPNLGNAFDRWFDKSMKNSQLLCMPSHLRSETKPRNMDFLAPIRPIAHEHIADREFEKLMKQNKTFIWHTLPSVIPCPTRGATHIIDAAVNDNPAMPFPKTHLPSMSNYAKGSKLTAKKIVKMFSADLAEGEESKRLTDKFAKFASEQSQAAGSTDVKLLMVEGPASSAKSSLVRSYVKNKLYTALVYVPSNRLRKAWKSDSDLSATVLTRHSIPSRKHGYDVGVIDEVFNFSRMELYLHMRLMARYGCRTIILLGDHCQREQSGIDPNDAYFNHKLQLHTSLGMPLDAHYLFVDRNKLDKNWYTTTGTVTTSIFFSRSRPNANGDVEFKMHGFAGSDDIDNTIGKVQGLRVKNAVLHMDVVPKQAAWINAMPNRFSVAVTRHTEKLIIVAPPLVAHNMLSKPLITYRHVGYRRPELEHTLSPRVRDDLVMPITSTKLKPHAARLRAILEEPLSMDGHHVRLEPVEREPVDKIASARVLHSELVNFSLEQGNFELPEPAEMDLVTDQPKRSFVFQPPGPPVQRTDVRNDLPESHKLASIQVNSSGFDSMKNLVDRQIATTKSSRFGTADINEGVKMYNRFVECYYRPGAIILDVDKQVAWLQETEVNALKQIVASEPLAETNRSLSVSAEFKTQTKAKAVPGFAATLPYGQSILANDKIFNATFANEQPKLYLNLAKLMRDDAILDYGMSDSELSSKLRKIGVAQDMNGPTNIQADVSKQDSSHTAAYLYCFILICRDCGLAENLLMLYLASSRRYMFRSRGADALRSSVSYNLGSGDPFTLIRNDVMEMTTIACVYIHAKTMVIVEKGDDVLGRILNLAMHAYANLPSVRNVKLKIDYGAVGYHAGRFHNGNRFLVDPVRAFLKHFTRLSDTNVTNQVLYMSYISRATDYKDDEIEFLVKACQVHYPFYSASQITMMIETMVMLRDRSFFERYSTLRIKEHSVVIDTQSNCAVNCVRAMRPGRSKMYYNQFRDLRLDDLECVLRNNGIPCQRLTGEPFEERSNVIYLTNVHAKVKLNLNAPGKGASRDL